MNANDELPLVVPADQPAAMPKRRFARERFHFSRLEFRTLVVGATLLIAAIATLTWYAVEDQATRGRMAIERQAQAIARNIAAASATLIVTRRYAEIEELVTRAMDFPDVSRAQVIDQQGRVLSEAERAKNGEPQLHFRRGTLALPKGDQALVSYENNHLVAWLPIEEGASLGWVRLEHSLRPIEEAVARSLRNGLIIGGVAIVLSAFLFVTIMRRPVRGIEAATAYAARLDALPSDALPVDQSVYEVAQLARALNHVSKRLRDQDRAVRSASTRLQAILQSAVDGIVTLDSYGMIESANPAAAAIFGCEPADLIGANVRDFVPNLALDDITDHDPLPREAKGLIGIESQWMARRRDGKNFPLRVGLSEFSLDERSIFVAIVRDLTEERKLARMKDQFIGSISHELRTPLTSLQGALNLLADDASGAIAPGTKKLIDIACKNSARLTRIIKDILDFEGIETGRAPFNIAVQELAPIVQAAIDDTREYAESLGVKIERAGPMLEAQVMVDPDRLSTAIGKLLANAVRFTPRGGAVMIAVERRKNQLHIAVTDRGPGIPEHARKHVFDKFYQVDSQDDRYKHGAGMGLSITKAIVERFGGTVDFTSSPNRETKFFIELPEVYRFSDDV